MCYDSRAGRLSRNLIRRSREGLIWRPRTCATTPVFKRVSRSVRWNGAAFLEQARGVGMVDLSAYDFIDGLGELRDLIDRWHCLHQDASAIETP